MSPQPPSITRRDEEERRLCDWLVAHAHEFNGTDWWLIDLVCRQGLGLEEASGKIDLAGDEAQRSWRGLLETARRHSR